MRKASAILLHVILLALLSAQFSSCEKYVLPELTVSADTLRFTAAADSQMIVVTTNVITTLYPESDATWVRAIPEWLEASSQVYIRVSDNPGSQSRSTTIPVKSEAILRNLVVIQEGTPQPDDQITTNP